MLYSEIKIMTVLDQTTIVRGNPDQELGGIRDQGIKNNTHLVKMKD